MNAIGYAVLVAMTGLTTVALTLAVEWRRVALRNRTAARLLHQALQNAERQLDEANDGWAAALDVIRFEQVIREGGLA